jgi:methionine-rich copper-binding protein CopC
MRALRILAIGASLVAALWAATVSAHAHLVSSNPGEGVTVASPPSSVVCTFDDDLDADTRITVTGPNGQTVSGKTSVSSSDAKVASAPITAAGNGTYTVNWRSVSEDDKGEEEGTFTFTVAPGGVAANSAAAAGVPKSAPRTGGGGMAPRPERSSTLPVALVLCLAAVSATGVLLRRRRA